jgi:DNA-binding NtrC family response regulator
MVGRRLRILVIEDEPHVRHVLRAMIEEAGHEVLEADGVRAGLKLLKAECPDVALVDHHLADGTASDILRALPGIAPSVSVVVLTGDGSIDLAVSTIRSGAHNFVVKPPEPRKLVHVLESAAASHAARGAAAGVDPFDGTSDAIRSLAQQAARAVEGSAPILLEGETGTGKSALARWIHARSSRATRPFLDVSAAEALPAALELELFGQEGVSGGRSNRATPGLLERATGGSLYVDEVGDLELAVQARLLKVIEEGRTRRSGGLADLRLDVRLFAATCKDLSLLVHEGRFRADLYYRIGAAPLRLPPLRERVEDIPALVQRVLESFGPAQERGVSMAPEAMTALKVHPWPGNVRELRQVVERAVLTAVGPVVEASDLAFTRPHGAHGEVSGGTLAEVERAHIVRILASSDANVGEAARRLGIPRSTLYERLKAYGIELTRGRRRDS